MKDTQNIKELSRSLLELYQKALKASNPNEKCIQLKGDIWVTKQEAERMIKFLNKNLKAKTDEEMIRGIKKDYDKITYIIGLLHQENTYGQRSYVYFFQMMEVYQKKKFGIKIKRCLYLQIRQV